MERLDKSVRQHAAEQKRSVGALAKRLAARSTRAELAQHAHLLLLRRVDARLAGPRVGPHPEPVVREGDEPADQVETSGARLTPDSPLATDDDWMVLTSCPACGASDGALVSEYNRFVVLGHAPEADLHVYNYTLCRRCGLVYASRRPRGARYVRLLRGFTESLGRASFGNNLLLNPAPLSDVDRESLNRRAAYGVFVSEHLDLPRSKFLPSLQQDRFAMAPHVELLGSLLSLDRARVLEVRSRTGALLVPLRRLYQAEVMALPIFESQQHVLRQVYDIPAQTLIDFERFTIPYEGVFDLIVANHMVTHALNPLGMLRELRARMRPGGHLYLYNEPDEAECLDLRQSMFKILNPFHMQTFDRESLLRLLVRAGFEPVYVGHAGDVYMQCLARASEPVDPPPISDERYQRRLKGYRHARDIAILRAPSVADPILGSEREAALERAALAGLVDVDERGRLHFRQ
jgi:hypothetical protein